MIIIGVIIICASQESKNPINVPDFDAFWLFLAFLIKRDQKGKKRPKKLHTKGVPLDVTKSRHVLWGFLTLSDT